MPRISTFDEAIADSAQFTKRHLLLGNGFSIGCRAEIFHYASLYAQADFSAIPEVQQAFEVLGTQDFEVVIRTLEAASKLLPFYAPESKVGAKRMIDHAEALKEILVSTIAANHPERPNDIFDDEFWACRRFLSHFLAGNQPGHVFSLNYDLLLYWTLMHDDVPEEGAPVNLSKNDSFGNDEDDPDTDYVVWQGETAAHSANIHFLHGAVHLFDAGSELQKYTWVRKGEPLVDQSREAIEAGKFPLFVAEGTSAQKKSKIRHHAYLYQCFKVLTANAGTGTHCFFVFGHSLAENDDHILKRLGRGKFRKMYVSLYGDPESEENKQIIARAQALAALRYERHPLEVVFFDAASANVWGEPE
ncbi:MAG: DUF4917 family protein [Hyphomonas oceanitis]|uniref:DUF4917 family protein n=1 Tax=Hyphomonas oceanitis TaxID=81033 RepID=UPI003000FF26